MIKRLSVIACGVFLCSLTSAQSLDDRVRELERRVELLERQQAQPPSSIGVSKPMTSQPDGWRKRENWRALKRGMNESDVRSLLGEPNKVNAFGTFTVWEYPERGKVDFGRDEKLDGWWEPR